MKAAWKALLGLTVLFAVVIAVQAEDKKEEKPVTLKGEMTCTKCGLKETDACGNCIKVKGKDDKEIIYYFKDEGRKEKYHGKICTAAKKASVTGVVSKEKDKMFITPSKDGVKFE